MIKKEMQTRAQASTDSSVAAVLNEVAVLPPSKSSARRSKIVLLEAVRGLAALYIFITHLAILKFGLGRLFFMHFGLETVMVFFILSGFVIFYSVRNKPTMTAREYFSRRFLRIYPILILALIITRYVGGQGGNWISNLCMLQDLWGQKPGVWFPTYGVDTPLWSLSYEWWFYVLFFPVYRFVPIGKRQVLVSAVGAAALAIYVVFPNQISLFVLYFPVWWAGVEVARIYISGKPITISALRMSIATVAGLAAFFFGWVVWTKLHHGPLAFGGHPVAELQHFSAALLILLIGCRLTAKGRQHLAKVLAPFALLAPISYAFYVFHMPLVVYASYLGRTPTVLAVPIYTAVLLLICYLAEVPLQKAINRIFLPVLSGNRR